MREETLCSASRNSRKKLLEAGSGKKLRRKKKTRLKFYLLDFSVGFYHLKDKQIYDLDLT